MTEFNEYAALADVEKLLDAVGRSTMADMTEWDGVCREFVADPERTRTLIRALGVVIGYSLDGTALVAFNEQFDGPKDDPAFQIVVGSALGNEATDSPDARRARAVVESATTALLAHPDSWYVLKRVSQYAFNITDPEKWGPMLAEKRRHGEALRRL